MHKREFVKLLAVAPLALLCKPSHPKPYEFRCLTCGRHIGHVAWPMRVEKEGRVWCAEHVPDDMQDLLAEGSVGLVTSYHFGVYPDGWEEYARDARVSLTPEDRLIEAALKRLKRDDPEGHRDAVAYLTGRYPNG